MRARFRPAFVVAIVAALIAAIAALAPSAAAEDPIGGPLLTGEGVVVAPGPTVPAPPNVDAQSYVLADAETGAILATKAPHQRLRPASTLKMLTAITLLPRLELDDTYTATYEDDAQIGSAVGIVEGLTYTIDELFIGLFLASGNDAAHALANAAGGPDQAVRLMQEEAERLQALDTTPKNTSGLDADGQFSSAYDLALIGRAGLQIPRFREYAATEDARFPTREGGSTYAITNHNLLLGTYEGAIGIKNGYTRSSGYTFIGAATRGGRTLIVSLMKGREDVHREAADLMDWGFAHAGAVEPVGTLVDPVPDEPTPAASPTAPPVGVDGAGGDGGGQLGLPDGSETPIAIVLGGFLLASAGAGAALLVRRVQRRRALRAELVHWATMRGRPLGYGPSPRRQPGRPPTGRSSHIRGPYFSPRPPGTLPQGSHPSGPHPTGAAPGPRPHDSGPPRPPGPAGRPPGPAPGSPPGPPEPARRGPGPASRMEHLRPPPSGGPGRPVVPPPRRPLPPGPDNDGRGQGPARYR